MKLVLTNDDGIDAPGILALSRALAPVGRPILVAPLTEQSGVSHRVTAHSPIRVVETGEDRYGIDGTPADCVRIAASRIAPDAAWIFSGINRGANLGVDIYSSGTVAAAREAALLGYKAVAISQYVAKGLSVDWEITRILAGRVLRELMDGDLLPGQFFNVNLPHPLTRGEVPPVRHIGLDMSPHAFHYREEDGGLRYVNEFHQRPRRCTMDVDCCFTGNVTVTRISVDDREGPRGDGSPE